MKNITTGILVAVLFVLLMSCSDSKRNISSEQHWKDRKWEEASLILSNISGQSSDRAQVTISNLCTGGKVSHASHTLWINAYVEAKREGWEIDHQTIQGILQNISDLQNRVYELENRVYELENR